MKVPRDLIAYNDLKRVIIDNGFCNLCGACEAACPVHALKVEENKLHYVHDCSKFLEFCPICYDVCPFTEALLLETLSFVTDAPKRRESIGFYRKIVLAQATDKKLRDLSHSGGVVTALLTHSIKVGLIDSVVASETEEEVPIKIRPSVSLVPDDLLSAVDCKYFPSAVAKAFGNAVHEYGKTKIAFVGTPCHVLALRKLEAWEHKIMDSLKIIIGLMCFWSFSFPELTKFLEEAYNLKVSDIKRIDLDKKYNISTKDGGKIQVGLPEVEAHTLDVCKMCNDFTSELADISVGGAHPLEDWSIVIIRTPTGEEFFDEAVKAKVIRVREIENEPDVFAHFVEMTTLKKRLATEEIERKRSANKPVPPAFARLMELLPREMGLLSTLKVEQIMTKEVMTVSPESTVEDLLSIMTKHHHMGYPVVNERKEIVGIVTFDDLAKVPAAQRSKVLVKDITHKKLVTVYPDDSVMEVYDKMNKYNIGRVLVVDRRSPKKLLGIVTKTDIIHTLRWPMRSTKT